MKLIRNPNDEQLSAWLGELSVDRFRPETTHEKWLLDIMLYNNKVSWLDDWPDLSDEALARDRSDALDAAILAAARAVARKPKQKWFVWYGFPKPCQQRRMRKGG